jgi:hypothetical protein
LRGCFAKKTANIAPIARFSIIAAALVQLACYYIPVERVNDGAFHRGDARHEQSNARSWNIRSFNRHRNGRARIRAM